MIKKIIFTISLFCCATIASAQNSSPTAPAPAPAPSDSTRSVIEISTAAPSIVVDEVAAIVGSSAILLSDIESMAARVRERRKEQGTLSQRTEKEEAFELLLTQGLLTTRARADSLDKEMNPLEPLVEAEVAKMVERAGGVNALEKAQGKPIYQIKADITLDIKNAQLAQAMEQKVRRKATVTQGEVRKFISTVPLDSMDLIPVQYTYSQIVKAPEQTDERKYAIRERLLEFRKRILDKEMTLSALARLYSSDRGSGARGGEMGPQPANTFVEAFSEAAKSLKPGEVSEIVETEFGYHLVEQISYDKSTDMIHVRHILLKPEFTVEEDREVASELDSLITEIRANSITFEAAALKYSDDVETKENGGKAYNKRGYMESGNIRAASSRFMPDELMPADYRSISRLKEGEISEPFKTIDGKGSEVYKIVRLDKIIDPHVANIDDDFDVLESVALKVKESELIEEWIKEWIEKTYIEIKPSYMSYTLDRQQWKEAAERSVNGQNVKFVDRPRSATQTTPTGAATSNAKNSKSTK